MKNGRLLFLSSVILAVPVCVLLNQQMESLWPVWRWVSEPVHASMVTLSCLLSLLSVVVLLKRCFIKVRSELFFPAFGLLCIGMFDGMHAISSPGKMHFPLLHMQSLLSGFCFALTWLHPYLKLSRSRNHYLKLVLIAICIIVLATLLLPAFITSQMLKGLGGIFCLIASLYFIIDYKKCGSGVSLSLCCLIFCILFSAEIFTSSLIWNSTWWAWHVLRLSMLVLLFWLLVRPYLTLMSRLGNKLKGSARVAEILNEKEALQSAILNAIPLPIYFKDPDGHYKMLNTECVLLNDGMQNGEADRPDFEEFPPEIVDKIKDKDAELMKKRGIQRFDMQITDRFGQKRNMMLHRTVVVNDKNELMGVVGCVQDVTQQKANENSLKERQVHSELEAEVGLYLTTQGSLLEKFQYVTKAMVEHLDIAFARIWTLNHGTQMLELQASTGPYNHIDRAYVKIALGDRQIGRIAVEKKPYTSNEVATDHNLASRAWAKKEGLVAFAGYPLIVDDQCKGVLALFAKRPLTTVTIEAIDRLSKALAPAIKRDHAERELSASASFLQATMNAQRANIAVLDKKGIILEVNSSWCSFARNNGNTQEKYGLGQSYFKACRLTGPDADEVQATLGGIRKVMGGELNMFQTSYACHSPDKKRWFTLQVTPLRNTEYGSVVLVHEDITEIKEAQLAYEEVEIRSQLLLEAVEEGIFGVDAEGKVIFVNSAALGMLGYEREELLGRVLHDAIHHTGNDGKPYHRDDCAMYRSLLSGTRQYFENELFWHKDGSKFTVDCRFKPIKQSNKFIGGVMTFNNITERRKREVRILQYARELKVANESLENAKKSALSLMQDANIERKRAENALQELTRSQALLASAKEAAENANVAKSDFLSSMSHEIRTPMNAVLGFLDLVLEDPALPQIHQGYLNTARTSARNLLQLINDILDLSKIEKRKLVVEKRVFNLPGMLKDIVASMKVKADEKGIGFQLEVSRDVPELVVSDQTRLRQIVLNLISNAVKFTKEGVVTLQVEVDAETSQCHFMVEDTGIGIPADKLTSIFDPFIQADSSTTRRFGGTGLGTAIARDLVELLGGRIWAESVEGEGSTFHFTVDLQIADEIPAEEIGDLTAAKRQPRQRRRGFRILVVDDVEANISLMKVRLEQHGHEVTAAGNGQEAVAAFSTEAFDIVLMDIHMPSMDGIEATKRIREQEKVNGNRTPVVAMTASVLPEEKERYLNAGMNTVVAKPVDFDELFAVMEKAVPQGVGVVVEGAEAESGPQSLAELPYLEGVDIKKGIETWQNADVYAQTLRTFAEDFSGAAVELGQLVEAGDMDGVYGLAHTLKGVAGNLSINRVAAVAETINTAIKNRCFEEVAEQLTALTKALDIAITSIQELRFQDAAEEEKKELDLVRMRPLFSQLVAALEEFNPYAVEPFLAELKEFLTKDQLAPIVGSLEKFDFDGAKMESLKLAENLQVGLDE